MCGICASLAIHSLCQSEQNGGIQWTQEDMREQLWVNQKLIEEQVLSSRLHHRGPDVQHVTSHQLSSNVSITVYGCTLHFRGDLTPQPLEDEEGNILLWNGEIFGGIDTRGKNDGKTLLTYLQKCTSVSDTLSLIAKIQGPWAMVYYQVKTRTLWFGRDVFGRRSLLLHVSHDGKFLTLSSVQLKHLKPWVELPAKGVYTLPCDGDLSSLLNISLTLYPWAWRTDPVKGVCDTWVRDNPLNSEVTHIALGPENELSITLGQYSVLSNVVQFNRDCNKPDLAAGVAPDLAANASSPNLEIMTVASTEHLRLAEELIRILGEAVRIRVQEQADVCDLCLKKRIEKMKSAQLIHCISNNPISEKPSGSSTGVAGGCMLTPGDPLSEKAPQVEQTEIAVDSSDGAGKVGCGHARVAVLFSGGIDSLVLAALADRFVPAGESIDLINVAFEQKPAAARNKKKVLQSQQTHEDDTHNQKTDHYNVPDRITGRDGVKLLNSARPWKFIEVNVNMDELQKARADHVQELVYPLETVLDDSIGCAIWFAARGKGRLVHVHDEQLVSQDYCCTARVVLVGMGADEQLAGYSRHRVKYNTGGMQGLVEEIDMEINRISSRNLGRDDRIISDHGKESRFPFLDENVVSFLNPLPVWHKADLNLPRGIGEKLLLRVAAVKLGLGPSAVLPKRAIQFGSRIAKMENRKEKASDICSRLHNL